MPYFFFGFVWSDINFTIEFSNRSKRNMQGVAILHVPSRHYNNARDASDRLTSADIKLKVPLSTAAIDILQASFDNQVVAKRSRGDNLQRALRDTLRVEIVRSDGKTLTERAMDGSYHEVAPLLFDVASSGHSSSLSVPHVIKVFVYRLFPLSSSHGNARFRLAFCMGAVVVAITTSFEVFAKQPRCGVNEKVRRIPVLDAASCTPHRVESLAAVETAVRNMPVASWEEPIVWPALKLPVIRRRAQQKQKRKLELELVEEEEQQQEEKEKEEDVDEVCPPKPRKAYTTKRERHLSSVIPGLSVFDAAACLAKDRPSARHGADIKRENIDQALFALITESPPCPPEPEIDVDAHAAWWSTIP